MPTVNSFIVSIITWVVTWLLKKMPWIQRDMLGQISFYVALAAAYLVEVVKHLGPPGTATATELDSLGAAIPDTTTFAAPASGDVTIVPDFAVDGGVGFVLTNAYDWLGRKLILNRILRKKAATLLIATVILFAASASAQFLPGSERRPITDVSTRAHVTVNGGAMVLTTGNDWSGASLGGTVLYNLHPNFSVFGGYDHGFPINEVDDALDFWRVVGSVKVHPDAFVGLGYGWFGDDVDGALVHLLVTKQVMPRLAIAGMYAHVFSGDQLDDFEYARVFLNYHLLGKE